jgi:hypothetical protein
MSEIRQKLDNLLEGQLLPKVIFFNIKTTMVLVVYNNKCFALKLSRQCFKQCDWDLGDSHFLQKAGDNFLPTLREYQSTPDGFESFLIWASEYNYVNEINADVELEKYMV